MRLRDASSPSLRMWVGIFDCLSIGSSDRLPPLLRSGARQNAALPPLHAAKRPNILPCCLRAPAASPASSEPKAPKRLALVMSRNGPQRERRPRNGLVHARQILAPGIKPCSSRARPDDGKAVAGEIPNDEQARENLFGTGRDNGSGRMAPSYPESRQSRGHLLRIHPRFDAARIPKAYHLFGVHDRSHTPSSP